MARDLILSSGFLAFARHVGFLTAVEEAELEVEAVCGTSSGALVGALWAAGLPAAAVGTELSAHRPVWWLGPSSRPWRGLLGTGRMLARLRDLLPPTFASLDRPLGVGVRGADGAFRLLREGPLPEAVGASCAIPILFRPVILDGEALADGGSVDRLGVDAWREWRPGRGALVHWVERTRGRETAADRSGLEIVKTEPSGASFWSLGDFDRQVEAARREAASVASALATSAGGAPSGGALRRRDR